MTSSDKRFSTSDITKPTKPVVIQGSVDDILLAPDAAIRTKRDITTKSGLQTGDGGGLGRDDSKFNERPEISDIESITHSTYYDTKQKKTMSKVVIRMRNSSGKQLLGIDARITIPVSSGGK